MEFDELEDETEGFGVNPPLELHEIIKRWKRKARLQVNESAHSRKIRSLLRRPKRGRKLIGRKPDGEKIKANCYGTTVYILNQEDYFRGEPAFDDSGKTICFIPPSRRPGYIDRNLMQRFLRDRCLPIKQEEREIGDIVSFWEKEKEEFMHSGVYIGKIDILEEDAEELLANSPHSIMKDIENGQIETMVHQGDTGFDYSLSKINRSFCICTGRFFGRPDYRSFRFKTKYYRTE